MRFRGLMNSLVLTSTLATLSARAQMSAGPVYQDQMTSQYNQGKFAAAEQTGLSLLRSEPSNLAVHYLLGNIYLQTARAERAAQEYTYCTRHGSGSQIGTFAAQGLEQMRKTATGKIGGPDPTLNSASPTGSAGAETKNIGPSSQIAVDKIDLEMLEYKERLLKTGADLIAANRAKLQRQIESTQNQAAQIIESIPTQVSGPRGGSTPNHQYDSERQRLEQDAATKIQQLKENNAAEELKITAFYKGQVDAISMQKGDLTSQTKIGNGDVRLVQQGSGLFVRNYINYHGEMPLPPLPPELHALAQKMSDTSPTKISPQKSKANRHK